MALMEAIGSPWTSAQHAHTCRRVIVIVMRIREAPPLEHDVEPAVPAPH